ncbi:MAG: cation diffusion facilitator CzcD-associated flavoprotein CzcO [Gammaproteobacteria bacterium]|jgi:cation diffusion facilitator CzcD-associated flavoprotein CzcO
MKYDAIIVGAGFAGMYMLYRLREAGFSARVLETADGVGGTWYWNRYPGARCDVKSIDYSFSFDDALQREWRWSEKYATQPEILRYANHVADRFNLRKDIQFETEVRAATFDEALNRWIVKTTQGETFDAQFYIFASGCLSVPKTIDITGQSDFAGATYHTADWPREGVDFSGLNVAVIGTGSSAIQSMPIIAKQARQLTVFQRTPAFSLPAFNQPLTDDQRTETQRTYAERRAKSRHSLFGVPNYPMEKSALEVDAVERERAYEEGWQKGELVGIMQQYHDLLIDKAANETASEFVRKKIRAVVKDPAVAETLCPSSFPLGTKRACLDTGYYEMFNEPHVELVDLLKTPIEKITNSGIKTSDREFEFDAIVFATGFDAMTGAIVNVDVHGVGGVQLADKWRSGPRAYLGLAAHGFPNLFMITGPGSPSVMSNMMTSIEQHAEWITDCLIHMREQGHQLIEANEQAEQQWAMHVNDVANMTLFPQADSWYMGANVPGKPRLFMPYIGGCGVYRDKCDEVASHSYEGFQLSSARAQSASAG